MPLYADQLPPDVRARLGLTGRSRRPRDRRVGSEEGMPLACKGDGCTAVFEANAETAMRRHQRATGHGRYEAVLP